MIVPIQGESLALGASGAIENLGRMESARILVVSDSHGQRELMRALIAKMGALCDAVAFCGDGAGDLFDCVERSLGDSALGESFPVAAFFVEGNNDSDLYPARFDPATGRLSSEWREIKVPARQIFRAAGKTIYMAHGHMQGARPHDFSRVEKEALKAGASVALFGHTHVCECSEGDVFALNPGSVKYPRDGSAPTFAALEISRGNVRAIFYRLSATLKGLECVPFSPARHPLWRR